MPIVIELRLRASWPVRPDTRQLHGLACALFEGPGADHLGQDKPFSVWPLQPAPPGSEHDWEWRATWLPAGPPPASAIAPDKLRLGHVTCAVTESTHRAISHAQLATGPPITSAIVTFHSPTYVSQNGSDTLIPDPRLIAGSWQRRWNASLRGPHPMTIDETTWRDTHRSIRLTDFDLRTEHMDSGRDHDRPGFTGTATLGLAKNAPAPARKVFATLLRFAEFSGTGAQTTHGFGATTVATTSGPADQT